MFLEGPKFGGGSLVFVFKKRVHSGEFLTVLDKGKRGCKINLVSVIQRVGGTQSTETY